MINDPSILSKCFCPCYRLLILLQLILLVVNLRGHIHLAMADAKAATFSQSMLRGTASIHNKAHYAIESSLSQPNSWKSSRWMSLALRFRPSMSAAAIEPMLWVRLMGTLPTMWLDSSATCDQTTTIWSYDGITTLLASRRCRSRVRWNIVWK